MRGKRKKLPLVLALLAVLAVTAVAASVGQARPGGEAIKVGLVSDVGRFNDKGFNQLALQGVKRAQTELGAGVRPIESRAASDYIPNLSTLARQKYNLVISVGFLLADATNTVAKKFPKTQFAIVDYSVNAPPFSGRKNVTGLTFATHQNSYMIGCLAALVAGQQGSDTISAVGGIKIPTVDIFIAGYRAGARKCVAGTKVLIGYSQDFVAQDKCKEVALQQIAQGSKVVFQVAGGCGLGALDAAKEQGVWGVGVDSDQSFLGAHILTSAVKRVDVSTFLAARRLQQGQRLGGFDLVFNLKNSGVGVGKISPKVPKRFVNQMFALRQQILDGVIKPPKTL